MTKKRINSDKLFIFQDHYFFDIIGNSPILKMFLYKKAKATTKRAAQPAIPMGLINNFLKNPNFYEGVTEA